MTFEAVIVELAGQPKGVPIRYTCTNTTGIPKGTLCVLSGATVKNVGPTAALPFKDPFAGIAATEKVASDGSTTIGLYTKGVFDLYAISGAAIWRGSLLTHSGANAVTAATAGDILSGAVVGKAMEAVAAGAADTIQVQVGIGL